MKKASVLNSLSNAVRTLAMANLPLVDTMHHALQAWCIFCGVRPNTLGQLGQKGRNRLTPSEALATVPFSVKSTQNLR